jgi:hypothetical protein
MAYDKNSSPLRQGNPEVGGPTPAQHPRILWVPVGRGLWAAVDEAVVTALDLLFWVFRGMIETAGRLSTPAGPVSFMYICCCACQLSQLFMVRQQGALDNSVQVGLSLDELVEADMESDSRDSVPTSTGVVMRINWPASSERADSTSNGS